MTAPPTRARSGEAPAGSPLLVALERLDGLLALAVEAARVSYGPEAATDPYRGLYIPAGEADRLLTRAPGLPGFLLAAGERSSPRDLKPFGWLARRFELDDFDLDVLLVALAPELDLRYERLYAYLQDDVTRRRPSVDLALNLLCGSRDEKLGRRAHFGPAAALIRHGLVQLVPDSVQLQPPLLGHYLKPAEQVVHRLLDESGLDDRLAAFCRWGESDLSLAELPLDDEARRALGVFAQQARGGERPPWLYFHGPGGAGKRRAAAAFAMLAGRPLLAADVARGLATPDDSRTNLEPLLREAALREAILYLGRLDAVDDEQRRPLLERLAESDLVTILAGERRRAFDVGGRPIADLEFGVPALDERRRCWRAALAAAGVEPVERDLGIVAEHYRLLPGQIVAAAAEATGRARWRAAARDRSGAAMASPALDELAAAARGQTGHELAVLTQKIEPLYRWDDLVLPDDSLAQLGELCARVGHRERVLDAWGFAAKLSQGGGLNALFAGPSGTGKTMAAEVLAGALGLDLYRIDLAGVVSKYIGETEKNLDRVFGAARSANAILFFDEADALFGKRSEVRDSHDRYANLEIAYLLQKMEQHDGLTVLATNLRGNLDESFSRRLAFAIHFPFPDEAARRRIWTNVWPPSAPLADDLDVGLLAGRFKLSGGNIKNAALAAAYLAAADGRVVRLPHVLRAIRREYQKMGQVLDLAEVQAELAGALA